MIQAAATPEPDREVEVRLVHPFQALKRYRCPGCGHAIERGVGHVVVVPARAPDLRRHWHRPCWAQQARRANIAP